ncbi:MAG: MinD/ParA family protein [Chitinispirillaceae bacterium]|nr:MinD/ParA family protein [Chitinispirillaceae bacterium]
MDQASNLRKLVLASEEPRGKTKTIAITSGKGGVGKSAIAVSLAIALANGGSSVTLLDADLGLANVHILLGIAPKNSLFDVVEKRHSFKEIITKVNERFDIIPGASGIEKISNLEPEVVENLIDQFVNLESNYDVLIIDTAAGISHNVINFASETDLTIVVMTPEPTSLADAYSLIKVLSRYKKEQIGVIVNMVFSEREGREVFDKLNTLVVKFLNIEIEYIGSLPYVEEVTKYIRKIDLLGLERKESLFYQRVKTICSRIYRINVKSREGFIERIWKKLGNKE